MDRTHHLRRITGIVFATALLFLYASLFVVPFAHAQRPPKLQIDIPTVQLTEIVVNATEGDEIRTVDIPWIAQYIGGVYRFGVGIAGALAAVMMMIGGFQYLTAGGDASRVGAAKKRISDALVGLMLTLGVYLILFTLNPDLVELKALQIRVVDRIPFVSNETLNFDESEAAVGDHLKTGPDGVTILKQGAYSSLAYLGKEPKCTQNSKGKKYTVKTSGCGIVSAAMAISYHKDSDPDQTLRELVKAAEETPDVRPCDDDCSSCKGTAFGPFKEVLSTKFGMKLRWTNTTAKARDALKEGKPVIALMGKSIFTSGGHYILLTGYSNGKYSLNDPYRSVYKKDFSKPKGSQELDEPINMASVPAEHVDSHFKAFIILEPK